LVSSTTDNTLKFSPKGSLDAFLRDLYVEREQTLPDLLKIKPRLCRVWDTKRENAVVRLVVEFFGYDFNSPYYDGTNSWTYAEMLTNDEIKQFFNEE
jgi:hypothetical protein